jgi:hypothetical protein
MGYIILLLIIFFPLNALATLATSVTVCDSGHGCTYTTIAAALTAVGNGNHTITVKAPYSANENITISKSGTGVGSELIIQANTGDTITVQGFTINASYVIIKGLRFYSPASGRGIYAVTNNSDYITLDGNTFTGASNRCRSIEQDNMTLDHWTIKNNLFTGANHGCGEPDIMWTASYSLIEDNEQTAHSSDFMYIWGQYIVIRNNKQHDAASADDGYDFLQTFSYNCSSGDSTHYAHHIVIEGNEQYNEYFGADGYQTFVMSENCGNLTYYEANYHHWSFRNNIAYNIAVQGNFAIPYVQILNNLFYYCNHYNQDNALDFYNENSKGHCTNMQIFNNIFIGNGNNSNNGWFGKKDATWPTGMQADYDYIAKTPNYTSYTSFATDNWTNGGWEAHGVNGGNPYFVDFSNHDYHLTANSTVLIDKGKDLSGSESAQQIGASNLSYSNWTTFNYDKDGNIRPAGAWDIGPYQYNTSEVPQPPKNLRIIN